MELYIETLTGAAFELRVSPFETIMSVKAKIQRLEGNDLICQALFRENKELMTLIGHRHVMSILYVLDDI